MKKRELESLMQLLPEKYILEAMQYQQAYPVSAQSTAVVTVGRGLHRSAAGICAAVACLSALVCGAVWMAGHSDNFTVSDTSNPVTEITLGASTTTEATRTQTTLPQEEETTTALSLTEAEVIPPVTTAATETDETAVQSSETSQTTRTSESVSTSKVTAQTTTSAQTTAASTTEAPPVSPTEPEPEPPEPVYLLGDVNMDGEIDLYDAQLLMDDYYNTVLRGLASELTDEQRALGDVVKGYPQVDRSRYMWETVITDYPINMDDVYMILRYFTDNMAHIKTGTMEEYAAVVLESGVIYRNDVLREIVYRADDPDETKYFSGIGTVPTHISAEYSMQLISYSYEMKDPEQVKTLCYQFEADGAKYYFYVKFTEADRATRTQYGNLLDDSSFGYGYDVKIGQMVICWRENRRETPQIKRYEAEMWIASRSSKDNDLEIPTETFANIIETLMHSIEFER